MGVLLSVVVPVFNGESFLPKCLESLQRAIARLTPDQQERLELVVCDNCSTDHSRQLAELFTFPCAYRVVQTPQHYDNRTENWRYGLGQLAGTWIMMLHADDLMAEEGLQSIFRACDWVGDRPAVMLTGRIRTFTDQSAPGRIKPYWGIANWIDGASLRRHVLPYICPFVPFCVMRQSAYRAVGELDPQYELVQDWDLWLRLLDQGALYAFPEVFGLWRTHGFSEKYSQIFAREHWAIAQKIQDLVPSLTKSEQRQCRRTQLAKVKNWLKEMPLGGVATVLGVPHGELGDYPDAEAAQSQLRWSERHVSQQLYRLRILGSLHHGMQRLGVG